MIKRKNTILLFSGGHIELACVRELIKELDYDLIIAIDKGLEAVRSLDIIPDYIVGDFDSVTPGIMGEYKDSVVKTYSSMKDDTDTQLGIELALSLSPTQIIIFGGMGTRMDHTLANIHLLLLSHKQDVDAYMIDSNNKVYLIDSNKKIEKKKLYGNYYSLLPLSQKVVGVTLKGFKYPLDKATIEIGQSIGISNEVVDEVAYVEVEKGIMIAIEARD